MKITFTLNGKETTVDAPEGMPPSLGCYATSST